MLYWTKMIKIIKQYIKKSDKKLLYGIYIYIYWKRWGYRKEALLCEAKIKTEIANNGLLNTEVTTF